MAKRKRGKRNPSAAQWAVLGVGGAVGLGLLGYGIYLAVKPKGAAETPDGSLGMPGETYEYRITPLTFEQRAARAALKQPSRPYDVNVYKGAEMVRYFNASTRRGGSNRARRWIDKQGGVAVCQAGCPQDVQRGMALPAI